MCSHWVATVTPFTWKTCVSAPSGGMRGLGKKLSRGPQAALPALLRRSSPLANGPAQQTDFLNWCLAVTRQRVKAIVGDLHRQSYGKAARLTAAWGEVLRLRGEAEAARVFVDELREQFPRHRAFQAELDTAMGSNRRGR